MYKYIKGHEVLMEEHMLSATELAKTFGLYTLNDNPNGLLVHCILTDYVNNSNLNISDYFYPHSRGVMRVYPSIVYEKALNNFVFDLEEGKDYFYIVKDKDKKSKVNYKYKKPKAYNKVIPITERRFKNGRE